MFGMGKELLKNLLVVMTLVNTTELLDPGKKLLQHLLTNHTSDLIPMIETELTIEMLLEQIIELNERDQYMVSSTEISIDWKHGFMTWDREEYGGIDYVVLPAKRIWRPDIIFLNLLEEDESLASLDQSKTRVKVTSHGDVHWTIRKKLKTSCPFSVSDFPFDTQKCSIRIGSATYESSQLQVSDSVKFEMADPYYSNTQWNLENLTATIVDPTLLTVSFTVTMKRKSLFYVMNLIIPTIVLSMLALLTLLLPAESGERIGLSITLLLSMVVFMLLITNMIPDTSETHPLVGIFFTTLFLEMALILSSLCFTMVFYHKASSDPPMATWIRKIVLGSLSHIVGVRGYKVGDIDKRIPTQNIISDGERDDAVGRKIAPNEEANTLFDHENNNDISKVLQNGFQANEKKLQVIAGQLALILEKIKENEKDEKVKSEWRAVGMTLDRCFFVVFLIILIVITISCYASSDGYVS